MKTRSKLISKLKSCLLIVPIITSMLCIPTGALATSNSQYLALAQQTHNFTIGNLLWTQYGSYADNYGAGGTTEWFDASQINADAALAAQDPSALSYMYNTYSFLGNLWDTGSSIGGYFAGASGNGTGAGGVKYVDDNALTGVAYLNAYNAETNPTKKANIKTSAIAIANWLMNSGLWDTTYNGGGFWWNNGGDNNPSSSSYSYIKGAEVNGLACLFFAGLYEITGNSTYKTWADQIKNWLDTSLYDASSGLYNWEYKRSTNSVIPLKFTYDNAILIQVNLAYYKLSNNTATSYLTAAQNLATNMIDPSNNLWNTTNSNGIFVVRTIDTTMFPGDAYLVNPTYCVWGSDALIDLYEVDGNTTWLNYAKQNIDSHNVKLRNYSNQGYYAGWAPGTNTITNSAFQTVDQAWMQREQARIAPYATNSDLSLTATASASSIYNSSFAASNVIDGNTSTEWASQGQLNPWIRLNWSTPQTMNSITFQNRANGVDVAPGGTLTFSDGSTETVTGIPAGGSPYTVSFSSKMNITWVKFQVSGGSGYNVGLASMQVWGTPTGYEINHALTGTASASSTYSGSYAASNVNDGKLNTEWASLGTAPELLNPWVKVDWGTTSHSVNAITFVNRANGADVVPGGTLTFSDGSTVTVTGIPGGSNPYTVYFPAKTVTWVKFQVSGGSGYNVGLAEFQVYGIN